MKYKQKKQKNMKFKRTALLVGLVVLIAVVLVISGVSCSKSSSGDTKETAAESQQVNSTAAEGEEAAESSRKNGEISDTSKTEASEASAQTKNLNSHIYSVQTGRFTPEVMNALEGSISSKYVVLYDVTADQIIFTKNADDKCYPASTTKLLTAITACGIITDPQKVITVGDEIFMIDEESSTAYLEKDMQLTFEMLIDALLIPSGNDAAYTIAVNCGRILKNDTKLSNEKALEAFMEQVNKVAADIGASHTHFVTPDGIHDDNHYTSAHDLAVIGDYAKTIPLISKSCAKSYSEWKLVKGGTLGWLNSNKMLQSNSGQYSEYCDGLKTGFTDEAGSSVVSSATINGHTFIAVAMFGDYYGKYDDCNLLFQKGFELYNLKYTFDGFSYGGGDDTGNDTGNYTDNDYNNDEPAEEWDDDYSEDYAA